MANTKIFDSFKVTVAYTSRLILLVNGDDCQSLLVLAFWGLSITFLEENCYHFLYFSLQLFHRKM